MGVKRDWLCRGHGVFESSDVAPICPKGCNTVEPIFLQPPAVRTSQRTKNIDSTLDSLAAQFGLTDLSTRNGSVMSSIAPHSKPDHIAASYNALYGDPRLEALRPRFASPNEVAPMMEAPGKRPFRGLDVVGDQLHARMGGNNVDKSLTVIQAETSKEDNARLASVLQGQQAA